MKSVFIQFFLAAWDLEIERIYPWYLEYINGKTSALSQSLLELFKFPSLRFTIAGDSEEGKRVSCCVDKSIALTSYNRMWARSIVFLDFHEKLLRLRLQTDRKTLFKFKGNHRISLCSHSRALPNEINQYFTSVLLLKDNNIKYKYKWKWWNRACIYFPSQFVHVSAK